MAEETANDVNPTVVTDTTPTESSPAENQTTDDDLAGFDEELGFTEETTEDEAITAEPEEETPEEPEQTQEAEPQEDQEESNKEEDTPANRRIRELVARAKEAEQRAAEYEQYLQSLQTQQPQAEQQPQTVDQYLDTINPDTGEYYTPVEAKAAVLEREVNQMKQAEQQRAYEAQIGASQRQIEESANRIQSDFPVFNPDSKEYNKALAESAAEVLRANLVVEGNQIIGSRVDPYQLYKSFSDVYNSGAMSGKAEGQKATNSMLRNADTIGSQSTQPTKQKDAFEESFDAEF